MRITKHKKGQICKPCFYVSASLTSMMVGCWLGWPSPSVRMIENNQTQIVADSNQISWIVASMDAGNAVSPIPAGFITDIVGRKMVLLFSGGLFAGTWLLAGLAHTPLFLYIARFFAGFSKGIVFTVVPMYLGEIASTPIRGALSTMFAGLLWTGTMYEFIIDPFVTFKMLTIISGIIPIIFLLTFIWMPDSPYYLLMQNRTDQAEKALRWFRNAQNQSGDVNNNAVDIELKEMKVAVEEEMKSRGRFTDLVSKKGNRRATLILMAVSAFQRLCGISPMLAYSSTTLPETNSFIGPNEAAMVFGIFLTLANFLVLPLIDRIGRKPLLIMSGGGCGILTGISAVYYYLLYKTTVDVSSYIWVPYLCLIGFGITHSIGIGVIPHTLTAELFPTNLRSIASSCAAIVFAVASFLVNKMYTPIESAFGVYAMYAFFSINGLLCALFSKFVVFETKGKTFVEIQNYLTGKDSTINSNDEYKPGDDYVN